MDINLNNVEETTKKLATSYEKSEGVGNGYFQAACAFSGILLVAIVILLGLMLNYVDKCETRPSACCPYFTNPGSLNGTGGDPYTTGYRVDNHGSYLPLDPNPTN